MDTKRETSNSMTKNMLNNDKKILTNCEKIPGKRTGFEVFFSQEIIQQING